MKTGTIGRLVLQAVLCCGFAAPSKLFAATDRNTYVVVESDTPGVESIVAVNDDFYVTTRDVSAPSFKAEITVTAIGESRLLEPDAGRLRLAIGESGTYRVEDGGGTEDGPRGRIEVLKIDIDPVQLNVSHDATACTLRLTGDSIPGGTAHWTSVPAGISGTGGSITFNPSALKRGAYTVTARSGLVPAYADVCDVRIVAIETQTMAVRPENRGRRKIGVGERVLLMVIPTPIGSVVWTKEGDGLISASTGAATVYTAGTRASTPTVTASFPGGQCAVRLDVVEPSGFSVVKVGGTGQAVHPLSVGMIAEWYIGPLDVNLSAVSLEEKPCAAVCSGYFDYQQNTIHLPGEALMVSGDLQSSYGWKCIGNDMITGRATELPYSDGVFAGQYRCIIKSEKNRILCRLSIS